MDVGAFLPAYRRFEAKRAAVGKIIMGREDTSSVRQRVESFRHRYVKRLRAPVRKIATADSVIRHEERVAREDGVIDEITCASRSVSRSVARFECEASGGKLLVVLQQPIELASVGGKRIGKIENGLEDFLHFG